MTFRQLAYSNVKGNLHQYIAFFLSSVFTVMIFYIYAAFVFHPDVINGHISQGKNVRSGLVAANMVIILFSFFFLLYSISAFLKSRKKEFGLLTLFGMTTGQIRKMVLYENIFIAIASIATGIGFGILFSKLFFMALAAMLDVHSPIRFLIPIKAVLLTAAGYFLLFLAITLVSVLQVGRSQIIELLQASRKPKKQPYFSWFLVILSLATTAAGYILAYNLGLNNFGITKFLIKIVVILALVVFGTYFLFTQSSVALFRRLQKRKSFFYRETHLITISQLVFKIKDNARVLFAVSILSAVVLTAMSTVNSYYQTNRSQMMSFYPQTIGFEERPASGKRVADPGKVKDFLTKEGVAIDYEFRLVELPVKLTKAPAASSLQGTDIMIVSVKAYNEAASRLKEAKPLKVEQGHAVYVYPFEEGSADKLSHGDAVTADAQGKATRFTVDKQVNGAIVIPLGVSSDMLVVNDGDYEALAPRFPVNDRVTYYGFELKNWEKTNPAIFKLQNTLVPHDMQKGFYSRVDIYLNAKQGAALTLFVGFFVSVLFFIASGSMIYFKLFTELGEDQAQFRALSRIGMTDGEIGKTVSSQVGLIFFIPCLVGIAHAGFAMKALANLMTENIWGYSLTVIAIFLVLQTVYFLAARRMYVNRIRQYASA